MGLSSVKKKQNKNGFLLRKAARILLQPTATAKGFLLQPATTRILLQQTTWLLLREQGRSLLRPTTRILLQPTTTTTTRILLQSATKRILLQPTAARILLQPTTQGFLLLTFAHHHCLTIVHSNACGSVLTQVFE